MVLEFRYSKALKLFISEFDSFKQRYFKEPPKVEGILLVSLYPFSPSRLAGPVLALSTTSAR